MSIDWLHDLEREVDNGNVIFVCPSVGRSNYAISRSRDDLKSVAQRTANHKKIAVNISRLLHRDDTVAGDLFLVPTEIGDPGNRGEPNIKWSTVDTKEAAEMMRDVRHGPSPYFGLTAEEQVQPIE